MENTAMIVVLRCQRPDSEFQEDDGPTALTQLWLRLRTSPSRWRVDVLRWSSIGAAII